MWVRFIRNPACLLFAMAIAYGLNHKKHACDKPLDGESGAWIKSEEGVAAYAHRPEAEHIAAQGETSPSPQKSLPWSIHGMHPVKMPD